MARRSREYAVFTRQLRLARLKAGMTQVEAGRAFGRQQSFIAKCESGERRVDIVELKEFARIYGVPITSLVP